MYTYIHLYQAENRKKKNVDFCFVLKPALKLLKCFFGHLCVHELVQERVGGATEKFSLLVCNTNDDINAHLCFFVLFFFVAELINYNSYDQSLYVSSPCFSGGVGTRVTTCCWTWAWGTSWWRGSASPSPWTPRSFTSPGTWASSIASATGTEKCSKIFPVL